MRGPTPNTSLPWGSTLGSIGPVSGAATIRPAANAPSRATMAAHRRPCSGPASSSTVPRARNGTLRIAPNRKKALKDHSPQPIAAPTHSAAEPAAKKNSEMVQAPSWRLRRSSQRSRVDRANASDTRVAAAARAACSDIGAQATPARRACRPAPPAALVRS